MGMQGCTPRPPRGLIFMPPWSHLPSYACTYTRPFAACTPPPFLCWPFRHAYTSLSCKPPLRCAPSLSYALLPCAFPEYKFYKVILHSITWTSRPSTTKKWLTTGYLDGDHSFYTHEHEHVHGCGCMYVRVHEIYLFIVNAYQIGSHIKLFASLYSMVDKRYRQSSLAPDLGLPLFPPCKVVFVIFFFN